MNKGSVPKTSELSCFVYDLERQLSDTLEATNRVMIDRDWVDITTGMLHILNKKYTTRENVVISLYCH